MPKIIIINHYLQFLNNRLVGEHTGGHLPFEFEITNSLLFGLENCITVAVNNTLSHQSIPPGEFVYLQRERSGRKQYPEGLFFPVYWFIINEISFTFL